MSYADRQIFQFDAMRETHEHGLFNERGDFDGANKALADAVDRKLSETYPGHPWGVLPEVEHGIVKIALQGFPQWPMVIHVNTLKNDPGMHSVMRYAGELLERLNMPRKGFSLADWRAANALRPHAFFRNAKAPE